MSTSTPSPVTDHLLEQLEREEATASGGTAATSPELTTDAPQTTASPNLTELTGLETMARPWRLFLLATGASIGLIAWILVTNGWVSISSPVMSVAAFAGSLFVGMGLLAVANERDRLGTTLNALSVAVGLSYAVVVWLNPTPLAGVDRWDVSQRMLVTMVAFAAGLVLAGVICLATIRRSPTLSVALEVLAGVFVLVAVTVMRENDWAGVVLFTLAFFFVLGAWDRSPRREVAFGAPRDSPRATRAALSLGILALCGTAIDYARHGENRSSYWLPSVIVAVGLIAFAVAVLLRLRSDLEKRETRLSDWRSWMREIRTNEFRRGFEDMSGAPAQPAESPFADLGEPLAAESEPPPAHDISDDAEPINESASQAQAAQPGPDASDDELVVEDPAANNELDTAAAAFFEAPDDQPTPGQAPYDFASADDAPTAPTPVVVAKAPPEPAVSAPPTTPPAIRIPVAEAEPPPALYQAPRPTGHGTFSEFAQPEPVIHDVPTAEDFAVWLDAADQSTPTLFVAVECMYLASFNELSPAYQTRIVADIGVDLAELSPTPETLAWIDGPYFLAAFPAFKRSDIMSLNKQLRALLGRTLTFDDVEIPLQGTLALLTPRGAVTFDGLLDDAVNGLIHARQLETPPT